MMSPNFIVAWMLIAFLLAHSGVRLLKVGDYDSWDDTITIWLNMLVAAMMVIYALVLNA